MLIPFAELDPVADLQLAAEGWCELVPAETGGFTTPTGPLMVRLGPDGTVEARVATGPRSANSAGGLHGGFLAAFAEQTLFLPLFVRGSVAKGGVVVIDFAMKYLQGGNTVSPIVSQVSFLHETGRLGFTRGVIVQDGKTLVSFSATLRKLPIGR